MAAKKGKLETSANCRVDFQLPAVPRASFTLLGDLWVRLKVPVPRIH